MNKDNIFRSSSFYMSENDVLHMIFLDEAGVLVTVDLQETPVAGEVINVVPGQAVAKAATNVTSSSFTANWNLMENSTGYYLDVATDSAFTSYVSGWQNKDMGNTISDSITGLDTNFPYYYRIRGYNEVGTGINSNIIDISLIGFTAADWFLPSKDELNLMYTELYLYGVGEFESSIDNWYWSSSEFSDIQSFLQIFTDGTYGTSDKTGGFYVRACRAFTSTTVYFLRDTGTAGGLIFYKNGNNYLEAAPIDQSVSQAWSDITNVAIGTTGTAIGTGQANTTAIINQAGGANDWFLPSKDELNAMRTELHLYGLGGFNGGAGFGYWSSSEVTATLASSKEFFNGDISNESKNTSAFHLVRACRAFTSVSPSYNLRDTGPSGGLIFWKSGNDYLEAAIIDTSANYIWSNVTSTLIGTTETAIGTGQANTNEIIGQAGHTASAAKLCNDYDNIYAHTDSAAKLCDDLIT